jgi:predicted DsbA family dithiol-disulfide isomerase
MTEPLRIDIVSDVMCPWCIIGYRQLATALEATGTPHEIHWHPFELNPQMPPEGQNKFDSMAEKYGANREQSLETRARLAGLGHDLGFDFQWNDDFRMYNTFNAHQLLHWAETQGRKHDLKTAMFTAYFTKCLDMSDNTVLADIAAEIGLDRAEALAVLDDQRFADEVRGAEQFWQQQGITGVPAMVFSRKHLVTGAQGVENYTSILTQLAEMTD